MYLASGRNKEAVAVAKELLGLNVTAPDGIGVIGVAIADPVEARRARDALEALASAAPEDFSHVANIHQFGIDGAIGDRAHARELLDRLLRKASAGELVSPDVIAEGYKALGDYDHAIEWWRRAVDQRAPYTLAYMAVTSRTHPVIGKDPRFLALLKRMGLEAKDERS
jgi:tetratricopeptide (TPR) repeat protein